jgi:hypothetical protein
VLARSVSQAGSWRKVEPALAEGARDEKAVPRHLVEFADLGPESVGRWIDIRAQFSRAIDPIVSSKLFRHPTTEVNLCLVAMGLEALGYLLALEAGQDKKNANNMRFSQRLTLSLTDSAPPYHSTSTTGPRELPKRTTPSNTRTELRSTSGNSFSAGTNRSLSFARGLRYVSGGPLRRSPGDSKRGGAGQDANNSGYVRSFRRRSCVPGLGEASSS